MDAMSNKQTGQISATDTDLLPGTGGQISWQSPANIALVKYWGKYPGQLPMNPSLSFTLKESLVRVYMNYKLADDTKAGLQNFVFNGLPNEDFRVRIARYLSDMEEHFPFLRQLTLSVATESTFPHSAGIASSAAAFSALALCLCELEAVLTSADGLDMPGGNASLSAHKHPADFGKAFLQKASFTARLGSGSACRSVEGGFVCWGEDNTVADSCDDYAVRLPDDAVDKVFSNLRDAVLIVDDKVKKVSSSEGHALMTNHPYRMSRIEQAGKNMQTLLKALRSGDVDTFFRVVENEALSLHSLMMSSDPGYILMKPNTIALIEKITEYRNQTGVQLGYTMDAGPNIHLIYLARDAEQVKAFIDQDLAPLCSSRRYIDDAMGQGPERI